MAHELPSTVDHAYGSFRKTLCGIELPDMEPSDQPWLCERDSACAACLEMAIEIDGRWPKDRRSEKDRVSIVKYVRFLLRDSDAK